MAPLFRAPGWLRDVEAPWTYPGPRGGAPVVTQAGPPGASRRGMMPWQVGWGGTRDYPERGVTRAPVQPPWLDVLGAYPAMTPTGFTPTWDVGGPAEQWAASLAPTHTAMPGVVNPYLTGAGTHLRPSELGGGLTYGVMAAGTHVRPSELGLTYGAPGAAPTAPVMQAPGGGGRAGVQGGPQFRSPPQGVDATWYKAFQQEHGGQTPEEFYRGESLENLSNYERDLGLGEAIADRQWSEGFQGMTGRPPTDDDWKAHWHASRPGQGRPWYEGMNPARVARIGASRRKWRMQRRREREGDTGEDEQRPPNWVPPVTYWR